MKCNLQEYKDLVFEAFVHPLRSVLIIDDEYPTWDKIQDNSQQLSWTNAKSVIKNFRSKHPFMIVDIEDKLNLDDKDEDGWSNHLTQSDLIILDYNLGNHDNTTSVRFIHKLLSNDQFNMVVVHTTEKDLAVPFSHIIANLVESYCNMADSKELIIEYNSIITSIGFDNIFNTDKIDYIVDKIMAPRIYAHTRSFDNLSLAFDKIESKVCGIEFEQLKIHLKKMHLSKENRKGLFFWIINNFESKYINANLSDKFVNVKSCSSKPPMWIRTDKGFITFANKQTDLDLLEVLKNALINWNPTPTRLISTILRSVISRQGVQAEDYAMSRKWAHGRFFKLLKNKNIDNSGLLIDEYLDRHFETLMYKIGSDIKKFSYKLLALNITDEQIKNYYDMNDGTNKLFMMHYNSYISCFEETLTSDHLTLGHVFKLPFDSNCLWICLSPACDMVPNQGSEKGILSIVPNHHKSFIAARLKLVTGKDLTDINPNSNNHIFISVDDNVFPYEIDSSISPKWLFFLYDINESFVVKNDIVTLNLMYLQESIDSPNNLNLTPTVVTPVVKPTVVTATIVAQLRPKYAINFAQKLGTSMMRVGLDYVAK